MLPSDVPPALRAGAVLLQEKGRVHSGLTRVVWELNPVTKTSGGTRFFTGSHKSAYIRPAELNTPDSGAFDTYECPAGSAIIFTEVTVPHFAEPFCTARYSTVSHRPCSTCARSGEPENRRHCVTPHTRGRIRWTGLLSSPASIRVRITRLRPAFVPVQLPSLAGFLRPPKLVIIH